VRHVFVDATYYIAALLPRDRLNKRATDASAELHDARLVTSELVSVEVFNHMSNLGPVARQRAVDFYRGLLTDTLTAVVRPDAALIGRAVALYEERGDKGYSLIDCVSMLICRDRVITEVLTHDHHFEQEGLVVLL
jgi:predicted nucleic acid-binding protein